MFTLINKLDVEKYVDIPNEYTLQKLINTITSDGKRKEFENYKIVRKENTVTIEKIKK